MRKCGAFAKRHKTAEGRLNADSDYVIEFLGHFVGNGVGAGFQNLIFGDASVLLDELAPGLNREVCEVHGAAHDADRKSTRLNSSHVEISYAVFCLKKKKKN